jgi:hypothetical protein
VVWEAAQVLKAHHASHELIVALTEWADKIASPPEEVTRP